MKLVGIVPVRNEEWCLRLTLPALLRWCDEVVVLLHACIDGSKAIVEELAHTTGRVHILNEPDERWDEMPMRQRLLGVARECGATHIAILDTDELLTANLLDEIRAISSRLDPAVCLELPGYNLRGGLTRYHANGIWSNRWFASVFCDGDGLGWFGDQFHHRHPMGGVMLRKLMRQGSAGVMHLWGASERRLRAKHALYKITERLRWPHKSVAAIDHLYSLAIHGERGSDARLGGWGNQATWDYAIVPDAWMSGYDLGAVNLATAPTQEEECARLIEQHGAAQFRGLDLFGMVEQCQQANVVAG